MSQRISIIHPVSAPWVARIFDGIHRYSEEHGEWHIFFIPQASYGAERSVMTLRSMKGWKGDGIIIASNEADELRFGRKWGIPMINLAGGLQELHGIPRVLVDNHTAGRMAAEHLLERDMTNLAYFGWKNLWYSEQRHLGFRERIEEAGSKCISILHPWHEITRLNWAKRIALHVQWLKSLPLPCGIFAAQDFRAQILMEACIEAGLRVPDDVAVVGMDNNETICEHSTPTLSSISRSSERVGYEAAAYLNRIINGDRGPAREILIPPSDVIVRQSSDMMYCSDPLVMQAIEYMRKHLRNNLNIEHIADALCVSKRKLERNFSTAANTSPRQYLIRLRIMHAQALMKLDTGKTIEAIAAESGFRSAPSFYSAFQRLTNSTPAEFRSKAVRTRYSLNRPLSAPTTLGRSEVGAENPDR